MSPAKPMTSRIELGPLRSITQPSPRQNTAHEIAAHSRCFE